MKRQLISAAMFVLAVWCSPSFAASYSDNFNRADANPLDGSWASMTGWEAPKIVSNAVYTATTAGANSLYRSTHGVYADNQYCQLYFASTDNTFATANMIIGVRSAANGDCYFGFVTNKNYALANVRYYWFKNVSGSLSTIGSVAYHADTSNAVGRTYRTEIVGSTLEIFSNGASQGTRTDTALTSGVPSVGGSTQISGASRYIFDNFEGGDILPAIPWIPAVTQGGPI